MMKRKTLAVLLMLAAFTCSGKNNGWTDRPVPGTAMDSWQFSLQGTTWENVRIPHSYNALDGHSKTYYRGKAHYRTRLPRAAADAPRYLLFEGVGQGASVVVGGDTLARHNGAYTPFWVNVSRHGGQEVEVVCDNSENIDWIPLTSDFNKNGGLHYPVWLLTLPKVHFDPETYGLYRLHACTASVTDSLARGEAKTCLRNASGKREKVQVAWQLNDADGTCIASHKETVILEAGEARALRWAYSVKHPHLWNGVKDPYLYTLHVRAGKDKAETEIGFRYFRADREKGFFLNGKPYPLRGVCLHQDKDGIASALTRADFDLDYGILRELGCNFVRLAHYPHNDYAFRLCDRAGLVVQTEIPWVNNCGTNSSDTYFDNIHRQMREMVTSLYNHPSIIFWGMWNELDRWSHKRFKKQGEFDPARVVRETERLYRFTKSLDPGRLVGLTDDSRFQRDGYTRLTADYYSENRYHGWYYSIGNFEALTPDLEWIRDNMGVTNLSEYGVGVNPFCHVARDEEIRRDKKNDSMHIEEYGNLFHESHAAQIVRAPYLNFTSLWVMFDFAVAARKEGYMDSDDGVRFTANESRKYTNDKGLITRDRKVRKDVFYLYKSLWNKEERTVYLCSRRLKYRPAGETFTLTVYSNEPSMELFCNGERVGALQETGEPTGVVWKFRVRMGDGPTTFRAQGPDGVSDEIRFLPL